MMETMGIATLVEEQLWKPIYVELIIWEALEENNSK
jgi:hypothetical protein